MDIEFPTATAYGHTRGFSGEEDSLRTRDSATSSEGAGGNAGASRALRRVHWKGDSLPGSARLPVFFLKFSSFWPKPMVALHDKFGRAITDLRISITDRCNYKCVYCRTGNEGALYGDLPFADYLRMARVLVGMGITKVRLTGGEPLLRGGIVEFVRELSKLRPQGLKPPSSKGSNGAAAAASFQESA